MAYGVKYIMTFVSRTEIRYTVHLSKKDFTGFAPVLDGGPEPFILNYQSGDDSIINAIRASEATISFYNDGSTPLSEFYSEDDQEWQVNFYQHEGSILLWTGYIVQDDCSEEFQNAPYLVTLRATDNIGLLKDIPFDEAYKKVLIFASIYFSGTGTVDCLSPGQMLVYTDATAFDQEMMNFVSFMGVTYLIEEVQSVIPTQLLLTIDPAAPVDIFPGEDWTILTGASSLGKFSLMNYFQAILPATGISLPVHVYSNLYENTETDRAADPIAEMFTQIILNSNMFLDSSGNWASCYEILEAILMPLNATLIQAQGKWVIIRQTELKLFANAIPGTEHLPDMSDPVGAVTLSPDYPITVNGANCFINADATRSILRPFKTVKHTFNYEQPPELIRNLNLREKGEFISENIIDPGGPDEEIQRNYQLPHWTQLPAMTDPGNSYLRIVYKVDPVLGTEVESDRYIVIEDEVYGGPYLQSSFFYIDVSDRVSFSFKFRTDSSHSGPATLVFIFQTDTGTNEWRINWNAGSAIDGTWDTAGAAIFSWSASEDIQEWVTFEITSLGCPVAGKFSIMLNQANITTANATFYKDFTLEYIAFFNETGNITGHYHLQQHFPQMKNKRDEEIRIDDSPRLALMGTLLTSATAGDGDHITKTKAWHRGEIPEARRLGEIATLERSQIQSKTRTPIEGTVLFTDIPNMLNVFQIDTCPDLNFIAGVMEINYMESTMKVKLWEIYESGVTDAVPDYTFEYIKELP